MLTHYKLHNYNLTKTDNAQEAIWTHLEMPSTGEFEELKKLAQIPAHILKDVQDPDEMPHLDNYDDKQVLFLDIPVVLEAVPQNQTRPFCIIFSSEKIYTFTAFEFSLMDKLKFDSIEKPECVYDVLIIVLLSILSAYITSIKSMEEKSQWDENEYHSPPKQNIMFFELLDLQKSLIAFEVSIDANHIALESIQQDYSPHLQEHQKLWVDNLIIESNQIAKMCDVFGNVLEATGNVAESIVSNDLNDVMKALTSITILLSIPTIVTGIFTMNTTIPSPYNHIAFPILLSLLLGTLVFSILKRRKML